MTTNGTICYDKSGEKFLSQDISCGAFFTDVIDCNCGSTTYSCSFNVTGYSLFGLVSHRTMATFIISRQYVDKEKSSLFFSTAEIHKFYIFSHF